MFKLLEPGDDAETGAGRNPLAEASPSVVTDAGGDSRAKANNWEKNRANDPKPRGDHNVLTHFSEGSEL